MAADGAASPEQDPAIRSVPAATATALATALATAAPHQVTVPVYPPEKEAADSVPTSSTRPMEWIATPSPAPGSPLPLASSDVPQASSSEPASNAASSTPSPNHVAGCKRKAPPPPSGPPGDTHGFLSRAAPHVLDDLVDPERRTPIDSSSQDESPSSTGATTRRGRSSRHHNRRSGTPRGGTAPRSEATIPDAGTVLALPHLHTPPDFKGPPPLPEDEQHLHPAPQWTSGSVMGPDGKPLGQTINCPMCRNGWQYESCGPAGDLLPLTVYRTLPMAPHGVHWSWFGRSVYTSISEQADVVSSDRGFRSARANVPVRQGAWYVEVEILPPGPPPPSTDQHSTTASPMPHLPHSPHAPGGGGGGRGIAGSTAAAELATAGPEWSKMKDGPHIRLGWGRRESTLNAPVGFDAYSYGFRDQGGERVTVARPIPYGQAFGPGDVVGMFIRLPDERQPDPSDRWDPARVQRNRVPIRYRNGLYYETLEYAQSKEMDFLLSESKSGRLRLDPEGNLLPVHPVEAADKQGAKRKGRTQPGQVDQATAQREKLIAALRPLPRLEGSQVGFFVNGQAQGAAFRNLLDYRPLRRADAPGPGTTGGGTGKSTKVRNNNNNSSSNNNNNGNTLRKGANRGLAAGEDDDAQVEVSMSASQATFLKTREQYFDDGNTGYFAFVSMFGGAQARINPGPHFRFPPPDDIDAALAKADAQVETKHEAAVQAQAQAADVPPGSLAAKVNAVVNNVFATEPCPPQDDKQDQKTDADGKAIQQSQGRRTWRPLSERAGEWAAELFHYDLQDEQRAQNRAAKTGTTQQRNSSKAKCRAAAAAAATAAAAAAATLDDKPWSFARASQLAQQRLAEGSALLSGTSLAVAQAAQPVLRTDEVEAAYDIAPGLEIDSPPPAAVAMEEVVEPARAPQALAPPLDQVQDDGASVAEPMQL